jgi:hypothetical protein
MAQELANEDVWPVCEFDRPPSRRTIGRFIDDLSGVVEEVFSRMLQQVLVRVELGSCFRIDGTDVRAPARTRMRHGITTARLKSTTTAMAVAS